MNVISNKEIFILLKILSNKRLLRGSAPSFQVGNSYTKEELEHLQKEISLANNKPLNKVIKIKDGSSKGSKFSLGTGYTISILDSASIVNFANKYVEAYVSDSLDGLAPDLKFITLIKEFYLSLKDENNSQNYVIKDAKYMPVILFAYINNLIDLDLKTLSESDSCNEHFADSSFRIKITANGSTNENIIALSDISELSKVMFAVGIDNQLKEIDAALLLEAIAKIEAQKTSSNVSYDENYLVSRLKKECRLSDKEINVLRAYKLYKVEDKTATNKVIAEFLTKNDYPISEDDIKQLTMNIKNKCVLPDMRGVMPIVIDIESRGYLIPPYVSKTKS